MPPAHSSLRRETLLSPRSGAAFYAICRVDENGTDEPGPSSSSSFSRRARTSSVESATRSSGVLRRSFAKRTKKIGHVGHLRAKLGRPAVRWLGVNLHGEVKGLTEQSLAAHLVKRGAGLAQAIQTLLETLRDRRASPGPSWEPAIHHGRRRQAPRPSSLFQRSGRPTPCDAPAPLGSDFRKEAHQVLPSADSECEQSGRQTVPRTLSPGGFDRAGSHIGEVPQQVRQVAQLRQLLT